MQHRKVGYARQYLEDLQRLALNFEEDATSIDGEMALLFQAGSSPGGARPKALINDGERAYLAKFASIKDNENRGQTPISSITEYNYFKIE